MKNIHIFFVCNAISDASVLIQLRVEEIIIIIMSWVLYTVYNLMCDCLLNGPVIPLHFYSCVDVTMKEYFQLILISLHSRTEFLRFLRMNIEVCVCVLIAQASDGNHDWVVTVVLTINANLQIQCTLHTVDVMSSIKTAFVFTHT